MWRVSTRGRSVSCVNTVLAECKRIQKLGKYPSVWRKQHLTSIYFMQHTNSCNWSQLCLVSVHQNVFKCADTLVASVHERLCVCFLIWTQLFCGSRGNQRHRFGADQDVHEASQHWGQTSSVHQVRYISSFDLLPFLCWLYTVALLSSKGLWWGKGLLRFSF